MSGTFTITTTVTTEVYPGRSTYPLDLSITNTGAILTTLTPAIFSDQTAKVVNSGVVLGGGQMPALQLVGVSSALVNFGTVIGGVFLPYEDAFTNTGIVLGGDTGLDLGADFATNSGYIYGAITGVSLAYIEGGTTLINTGSIGGGIDGITEPRANYAGGAVINGGTITGGVDALYIDKYYYATSRPINPIRPFILTADPGAVFNGYVIDHANNGELILGAGTGELDLGGSFIGFSTISLAADAQWVLSATKAELAAGQTISGFTAGNTIILDGFSATSESFVTGIGLELSGPSGSATLDISALHGSSFALSAAGGNSTIAAQGATAPPTSIISTLYTTEVTPGAGTFAAGVTITDTGGVSIASGSAVYAASGLTGISLDNAGHITGSANAYTVKFLSHASIANSGSIGGRYGVYLRYGTVSNTGTISSRYLPAVKIRQGGVLINSGDITGGNIGANVTGTLINYGTISGSQAAYATQLIEQPSGVLNGVISGVTLDLAGSTAASLILGTAASDFYGSSFREVNFDPGANWVLQGSTAQLADGNTITGFADGDTIVLDGFAATGKVYAGGAELVLTKGPATETLDIIGSFATGDFFITDNAQGGTEVSLEAPCFCAGTRITTDRGNVPVERLRIGDRVKTMRGFAPIQWIGMRSYDGRFLAGNHLALPVRIRRHAIAFNVPSRDLYVSPDHAIAEGGVLIHAWRLVNGASITQLEAVEEVHYFHIELARHDVIFAENVPVESFIDEATRHRFQNAASAPAAVAQKPCLPRVAEGFYLERIRGRIARRAGVVERESVGTLRGCVDEATNLVRGWAQDVENPEVPVTLHVFCGGQRFTVLANAYRPDLRAAGLGSGCHGFTLALPGISGPVAVRRACDGAEVREAWRQDGARARAAS